MRRGGWLALALGVAGCFDGGGVVEVDAGAVDDLAAVDDRGAADAPAPGFDVPPPDVPPPPDAPAPVDLGARCTSAADCDGGACAPDGRCVACIPTEDRCPAAQHCDSTTLTCVPGCRSDEGCPATPAPDGGTRPAHCDPARHVCVDCETDDDCPVRSVCRAGQCTPGCNERRGCATGEACCEGTCTNTLGDVANCGACGRRCAAPNGVPSCAMGDCGLASCNAGYADCNRDLADGCEANLQSDPMRCGGCAVTCPRPPGAGTVACSGGRCGFLCAEGMSDCDGDSSNGCERMTSRDASHCGRCNNACPARVNASMPRCDMGVCGVNCNAGYGDCDGDPSNGCETGVRTSVAHCGACGAACPGAPNATPSCAAGRCGYTCNAGYGDCDGNAANGCETDTRTAAAHCGGCGAACVVAGGMPSCVAGACTIGRCDPNAADCDGNAANGCETDPRTSASHCGGCGRACPTMPHSAATCAAGACGVRCEAGYGNCDGSAANGCEADLSTDPANCGGCGVTSAMEVCDGRDNDCDRTVDEGCPTAVGGLTTYDFTSPEFGTGTMTNPDAACPAGRVARGVFGTTSGIVVTSFGVICGAPSLAPDTSTTPYRYNVTLTGSTDGSVFGMPTFGTPVAFRYTCPGNAVVTRMSGLQGPYVYQFSVSCSTLAVTGNPGALRVTATAAGASPAFGGGGMGNAFDYTCPSNGAGSVSALRALYGRSTAIFGTLILISSIGARCSVPTITVR